MHQNATGGQVVLVPHLDNYSAHEVVPERENGLLGSLHVLRLPATGRSRYK